MWAGECMVHNGEVLEEGDALVVYERPLGEDSSRLPVWSGKCK